MSTINNNSNNISAQPTEWVILSYNLKQKEITTITNNTPEGGTRMMLPSGNIDNARKAYRLLQAGGMKDLFEASKLADTWYAKKGNLVLAWGTEIRGIHSIGKKANKRIARALAPATWANLPIPVTKIVPMTRENDGHGWVSMDYLKRNGIKTPQGRRHFSFILQDNNKQYKGACVVAKLPVGIDMVLPDDPKTGVEYDGQFFSLTMGYSHTEPRIDVQSLSNTIRWMDYSDVVNAQAVAIASRITHANVDGRKGMASYVNAGVIPALVEEYRKQEIKHLTGEVAGGFKIPAVTGLIAFSKSVAYGHIRIDRKQGLIVCNPSDYVVFQFILGGMDGDDHVIAMFVEKDSEVWVYLYRQPNQLGEGVFMKLDHWEYEDMTEVRKYTTLPLVKVVGEQPKPTVVDMVEYVDATQGTDFDMFKSVIEQQVKSATYIGRVANLSMLKAVSDMTDGEFPDFESMIGLELKDGNTDKLDAWCEATEKEVSHYMGGCTTLPITFQQKAHVAGATPYLGDIVHKNLRALDDAIEVIRNAQQVRIGYDSVFAVAKIIVPTLPVIKWVEHYGKLVHADKVREFDEYIAKHIAEVGAEQFEKEVYVALVRTWFTNTGYALLHKGVYEVVCTILNRHAMTESATQIATMFNLKMDVPETVYIYNGGMYTGKGEFIGVCKIADGEYQTVERDNEWKFTVHRTNAQRWQFVKRVGKLTNYRKGIIRKGADLPSALKVA